MTGDDNQIGPCSPFFVVSDIATSLSHYVDRIGFVCSFRALEPDPFFAIANRGAAQIMLKVIGEDVPPLPNHHRHEWARLDAFIYTGDPDALAREFEGRNVPFHPPLQTGDDGLFGFEIADPDGYVCFFGRPAT